MKIGNIYILAILSVLICSCNDYTRLQKTADFDYKYELGKQLYAEGKYNQATLYLQDVIAMLKGTDKGEESLFLIGMSSYRSRNYESASTYFRKYYQSYPRGIYAEKARYYCGLSLYNNTPEIKLDQTATFEAVTEFQNYLETYPSGEYSERSQQLIFKLQDRLVEKEYLSAKLYYDLGSYFGNCTNGGSNYQACIVTAENAIKDYPYTSHREDFAILILRAKFELAAQSVEAKKADRYHDAIDEYYGFTNEYPESKHMSEAKALFRKAAKYVSTNSTNSDSIANDSASDVKIKASSSDKEAKSSQSTQQD